MFECLVLAEACKCFFQVRISMSMSINLINRSNILSPNLMYNVRTIRFISIFLFEEAKLPSLTKLFEIIIKIPVIKTSG